MSTYGQFCPVALASELLTRRWTPLVIREMLCGSTRFNEIRRGVPKMSPSLLSTRLDELRQAGVLERRPLDGSDHYEYVLTRAGRELQPVIEGLGAWGIRWISGDLPAEDLDVELLMWDVRRRIDPDRAPSGRTVVRFHYEDQPEERRDYWIVVDGDDDEVDLCWQDPGYDVDLTVKTSVRAMTRVWRGDVRYGEALRRHRLTLRGPAELRRSFPEWLGYSMFAKVDRPA